MAEDYDPQKESNSSCSVQNELDLQNLPAVLPGVVLPPFSAVRFGPGGRPKSFFTTVCTGNGSFLLEFFLERSFWYRPPAGGIWVVDDHD